MTGEGEGFLICEEVSNDIERGTDEAKGKERDRPVVRGGALAQCL